MPRCSQPSFASAIPLLDRDRRLSSPTAPISDSFALPDHYLSSSPSARSRSRPCSRMFSLYEPQRGAAIGEELRRLTCRLAAAWRHSPAATMFATKMGDTYSRVWVGAWLRRRVRRYVGPAHRRALALARAAPARPQPAPRRDRRRGDARTQRGHAASPVAVGGLLDLPFLRRRSRADRQRPLRSVR